jgi:hypothetical protein
VELLLHIERPGNYWLSSEVSAKDLLGTLASTTS